MATIKYLITPLAAFDSLWYDINGGLNETNLSAGALISPLIKSGVASMALQYYWCFDFDTTAEHPPDKLQ